MGHLLEVEGSLRVNGSLFFQVEEIEALLLLLLFSVGEDEFF